MDQPLQIDVYFDFICPWCLIGKRQLQSALTTFKLHYPETEVNIQWHGVQLLPNLPKDGVPFYPFYLSRLGSADAVQARQAQVRAAANQVGVDIKFDSIPRMPNTSKAHNFFEKVTSTATTDQIEQLLEGLFAAYFNYSEDISDTSVLMKIAACCGFSDESINTIVNHSEAIVIAAETNIHGLPYFVFDRRWSLSGAQPVEVLFNAMQQTLDVKGLVS